MTHVVEPTGRDDEWQWQVKRLYDGVVVGFYATLTRAANFADNAEMHESSSAANPGPTSGVAA